ncbi:CpsD/CapB family tyrosine-protein kinase [Fusobacterium perfoetens]|uniref:CpsD/CapB family tyrosine-protein kinase n=1 Tax=Fusobacterium perfoetens TaxID=852 RepID=UPI001F1C43A7|nr:CpsD/CapB family tyrosine-protein kinase [Fusobacterium perfoetens]MCF2612830.1 CpsD/CapB family tyrosine-protein kinase [Fusobacterium perfoetens]
MSKRGIFFVTDERPEITEAFRTLRTNLAFLREKHDGKTLLFTSSIPAEGKSTVASNYAASLAIAGRKTLIIDCDIRRPRAHESFGIKIEKGLECALTHDEPVKDLIMKDVLPNLDLLPTKNMKNNVTELFLRDKMKDIIGSIKDEYDTIILDTPPLAVASDAAILSRDVDGVVVVVGYDQVAERELKFTKEMLDNAGANIYGFIVNGVEKKAMSYGNYGYYTNYYSYYEEYYNDDNGNKKKRKVHKKPKNKLEAFIYRLKEEYTRHLSGDIKRRR